MILIEAQLAIVILVAAVMMLWADL